MNMFKRLLKKSTSLNYTTDIPNASKSKLALAIVARDEIETIEENIKFHLAQGVDIIIATDNNSKDGTLGIFKKYEKLGKLHLIQDNSNDHDQSRITNNMIKVAREQYNIDWVLIADADELFLSKWGNLKINIEQFEQGNYNVAFTPMFNIYPETKADTENKFYLNTKGFYSKIFDHPTIFSSKAFIKTKDHRDLIFGNHETVTEHKHPVICTDITLFHYPMRTLEQYRRKYKNLSNAANNTKSDYIINGNICKETYNNIEQFWFENIIENRKDKSIEWIINSGAKDFILNGYQNTCSAINKQALAMHKKQ